MREIAINLIEEKTNNPRIRKVLDMTTKGSEDALVVMLDAREALGITGESIGPTDNFKRTFIGISLEVYHSEDKLTELIWNQDEERLTAFRRGY